MEDDVEGLAAEPLKHNNRPKHTFGLQPQECSSGAPEGPPLLPLVAEATQYNNGIPDLVTYYPVMVFEDVRILQPGLLFILNKWFREEISKKPNLAHVACGCQPVMAVSINTLYLYDNLLYSRGLTNVIDEFVRKNSTTDKDGNTILFEDADFDNYLRQNPFHKSNILGKWLIKG